MRVALCYHEAYDKYDPQVNGEHRERWTYLLVSASEQPEIFAIIAIIAIIAMHNGEIAAIKPTGLWY